MESNFKTSNRAKDLVIVRFVRWLFSWRTIRRALVVGVVLLTIAALLWAEESWRAAHEWKEYKEKWEAKGEHFSFASFIPRPVPDDQNFFMALVWKAALDKERGLESGTEVLNRTNVVDPLQMTIDVGYVVDPLQMTNEVGYNPEPPETGWLWLKGAMTNLKSWQEYYRQIAAQTNFFPVPSKPRTPAKDVLFALSKYDSALTALRQASDRPDSRLPWPHNTPPNKMVAALQPTLTDLHDCAQVLQLRAVAELADGQDKSAFRDVETMLRLSDSIRDEPSLLIHLVRNALISAIFQPVFEGLARHQWTDSQLTMLDRQLSQEDILAEYGFAMRSERAFSISMTHFVPAQLPLRFLYCQNMLASSRMFQQWILPCVNVTTRVVSPANVRRLQQAEASAWKHRTWYCVLAKMTFPALITDVYEFAILQSHIDLARVACALERYRLAHGQYPETLDVIVPQFMAEVPHDIINGQPLHYRRTKEGRFVLYSVGWNEKDDGGSVGLQKYGLGVDWQKGDWVWRYPAK